jgi:hypothetical protein
MKRVGTVTQTVMVQIQRGWTHVTRGVQAVTTKKKTKSAQEGAAEKDREGSSTSTSASALKMQKPKAGTKGNGEGKDVSVRTWWWSPIQDVMRRAVGGVTTWSGAALPVVVGAGLGVVGFGVLRGVGGALYHEIEEGDTLCDIAGCYRVDVMDLYERNRDEERIGEDPNLIYPGDRLRIR